jgi:hypothetical protein
MTTSVAALLHVRRDEAVRPYHPFATPDGPTC